MEKKITLFWIQGQTLALPKIFIISKLYKLLNVLHSQTVISQADVIKDGNPAKQDYNIFKNNFLLLNRGEFRENLLLYFFLRNDLTRSFLKLLGQDLSPSS